MSINAQGQQANAAGRAGAYNAGAAEYNAEVIRKQSVENATRIMEEAQRVRSTQVAQQAASGVVIGLGSADVVTQETDNLASRDALVTLYSGIDGVIEQNEQGRLAMMSAQNQVTALRSAQTATLLQGVGNVASSYTTYKALTKER